MLSWLGRQDLTRQHKEMKDAPKTLTKNTKCCNNGKGEMHCKVKCCRPAKHTSLYLSFFSFSCRARTFSGACPRYEGESVSMIRTSNIVVDPRRQNPWTATSPRSSGRCSVPAAALVSSLLSRHEWIRGSLETAEGERALAQSWRHSAATSLWWSCTSPPFLHVMACPTENFWEHPSQRSGRERGVSP